MSVVTPRFYLFFGSCPQFIKLYRQFVSVVSKVGAEARNLFALRFEYADNFVFYFLPAFDFALSRPFQPCAVVGVEFLLRELLHVSKPKKPSSELKKEGRMI